MTFSEGRTSNRFVRGKWQHAFVLAFFITVTALVSHVRADVDSYWAKALHLQETARPLDASLHQFSSYSRDGSNEDYQGYLETDEHGDHVICEMEGPGMITHMWTTYQPLTDAVRFKIYIDGSETAVIDTPAIEFYGRVEPFVPPLADSVHYSRFSYVPIPFESHIRITKTASNLYYEIHALEFEPGAEIESFSYPLITEYEDRLDSLATVYTEMQDPMMIGAISSESAQVNLNGGDTQILHNTDATGYCTELLVTSSLRTEAVLDSLWLAIYVDHYPLALIDGPLTSVMGAALGWHPYESMFTGMRGDSSYLRIPMPVASNLRVTISNRGSQTVTVGSRIELAATMETAVPDWRLQSDYRSVDATTPWVPYEYCDFEGAGNFLGILWQMEASPNHCLEGDVLIYRDNEPEPFWKGTGTEDHYNGAYYWISEEGDRPQAALSAHGLIRFDSGTDVAAYRWHVSDPVPFEEQLRMESQVGPYGNHVGDYESTAWAYLSVPRWRVVDRSADGSSSLGESLRLIGSGIPVGAQVNGVTLAGEALPYESGDMQADADAILDVTFTASPSMSLNGALVIDLSSGIETIDESWMHYGEPALEFSLVRIDPDSLSFGGDSLRVRMLGLVAGSQAELFMNGNPVEWSDGAIVAGDDGILEGYATLPYHEAPGSFLLEAVIDGAGSVFAEREIHYRDYYRMEVEDFAYLSRQGRRYRQHWAPHYTHPDSFYSWGQNVAGWLDTNGEGDSLALAFDVRDAGVYQINYFLGEGSTCGIVEGRIDGVTDFTHDAFVAGTAWRIVRSDTILGQAQALSAGTHVLTLKAIGRHPEATAHDVWTDQVLIKTFPSFPPEFSWTSLLDADSAWQEYTLSWQASDPDNDAAITLYAVSMTDDTTLLTPDSLHEDFDSDFVWQISEGFEGWYRVFARIFDGYSLREASAPGSLKVVPPVVEADISELDFGIVRTGTSAGEMIEISNPGFASVIVSDVFTQSEAFSVSLVEAAALTRAKQSAKSKSDSHSSVALRSSVAAKKKTKRKQIHSLDEISFELLSGESRFVEVTFAPTSDRAYTDTLRVVSNAEPLAIPLFGTGGEPELVASTSELDFGEVVVESYSDNFFSLINDGHWEVSIDSARFLTGNVFGWSETYEFPMQLEGLSSLVLSIRFSPVIPGIQSDTLAIYGNEGDSLRVALTGEGVTGLLVVEPLALDFGVVELTHSDTLGLRLINSGGAALMVNDILSSSEVYVVELVSDTEEMRARSAASGKQAASRAPTRSLDELSFELAPADTQLADVIFMPVETVDYSESLIVDSDVAQVEVPLTGRGAVQALEASESELEFGRVGINSSVLDSLILRNPGELPVQLESYTIVVGNYFALFEAPELPTSIAPMDSLLLVVEFSPEDTLLYQDVLRLGHSAGADLLANLTGRGELAQMELEGELSFGEVWTESTLDRPFTLRNTGNAALAVESIHTTNLNFGVEVDDIDTLHAGEQLNGNCVFLPTDTLNYAGYLVVETNLLSDSLLLAGRGIWTELLIDPLSYSFETWQHSQLPETLAITISSTGNTSVTLTTVLLNNGSVFEIVQYPETHINAYGSTSIRVSARNDTLGWFTDALAIIPQQPVQGDTVTLELEVVLDTDPVAELPSDFFLSAAYPNPFNPSTSLEFGLPQSTEIQLSVYDVLGRQVDVLVQEQLPAGRHKARWDCGDCASGIYMFVMTTPQATVVRKAVLMK